MNQRFGVCVAIVILSAACTPAAGSSAPPATSTAAPTASSSPDVGGGAGPTTGQTTSPFGRHDSPPGGVAEFLDFMGGGGGSCIHFEVGPPSVKLDVLRLPVAVCAFDFAPGQTVDFSLRGPDGSDWTSQQQADQYGTAIWELDDLPDPIAGEYTMQATQGEIRVATTSRVAINGLETVVLPDRIRIGETTRVFIAGGPPGWSVSAHLYGAPQGGVKQPDGSPGFRYEADVGPIVLDARGEGRLALTPRPEDPPGHYVVVVGERPGVTSTQEPAAGATGLGEVDEYLALAESAGLDCSRSPLVNCLGDVGGARFTLTVIGSDATVQSVWATSGHAPDEALALLGGIARIASGLETAQAWVRSDAGSADRRFGRALVSLTKEMDGSMQMFIAGESESVESGQRVEFEVEP